jgi:hypothetical protein
MPAQHYKASGISLIIGSLLMVVTMVLHPSGGSIEQILRIINLAIISHSLAILSTPFLLLGFWGLTNKLKESYFFAMSAFMAMATGLIAVMIAAAVNGIALPLYAQHYAGAPEKTLEIVRHIMAYGTVFNHAFDYIFIGATCLAVLFWSISILDTKALPQWLAYLGIIYFLVCGVMFFMGFSFLYLHSFTVYIFGSVVWILLAAFSLLKMKSNSV